MSKAQVINLVNVPNEWLRLALHIQNGLHSTYHLTFPDADAARKAASRMSWTVDRHSEWFNLVICQRGSDVYVLKPNFAQKVVIHDGDD